MTLEICSKQNNFNMSGKLFVYFKLWRGSFIYYVQYIFEQGDWHILNILFSLRLSGEYIPFMSALFDPDTQDLTLLDTITNTILGYEAKLLLAASSGMTKCWKSAVLPQVLRARVFLSKATKIVDCQTHWSTMIHTSVQYIIKQSSSCDTPEYLKFVKENCWKHVTFSQAKAWPDVLWISWKY